MTCISNSFIFVFHWLYISVSGSLWTVLLLTAAALLGYEDELTPVNIHCTTHTDRSQVMPLGGNWLTTLNGMTQPGRYLMFSCRLLMMSVNFFPLNNSSFTHRGTCCTNILCSITLRPTIFAITEPLTPHTRTHSSVHTALYVSSLGTEIGVMSVCVQLSNSLTVCASHTSRCLLTWLNSVCLHAYHT